jgi:hypothetical protein
MKIKWKFDTAQTDGDTLRVQGDFLEPPRRDLKIPLLGLCILSTETERMGLPGLRARPNNISNYNVLFQKNHPQMTKRFVTAR